MNDVVENEEKELRFLRLSHIKNVTGLSESQIYHLVAVGKFPTPVKLGVRASGWVESEVLGWMRLRISESMAIS